ncbi:hypothetical protein ALC56_00390 [Trachymyrmex septentrionalis]|uniref:Uncharacterized protein n=1 Tax=Trachymyrmex septentrionalis TaxID=34720 RepID=A0A195FWV7_9HYME|nr:hypothetical protein ALC56_00390 [Trachymyrmex septentrionalis]
MNIKSLDPFAECGLNIQCKHFISKIFIKEKKLSEGYFSAKETDSSDGGVSDLDNRQVLRKSAQTVHLYRYRRFTMSVYVDQVVCCEAKTEARKRCCKLYDRATHGGRKHLKPASWITAKKLPALPISGYVCRGCRREFQKVSIFRDTDRMSFQCCIDVMKRFRTVMKKFH